VRGPFHFSFFIYIVDGIWILLVLYPDLDQILGFVERLFNDPYFRFAPHKIAKKFTIRRAERSNLLLLHLRN
jgi:hypothetical protein